MMILLQRHLKLHSDVLSKGPVETLSIMDERATLTLKSVRKIVCFRGTLPEKSIPQNEYKSI